MARPSVISYEDVRRVCLKMMGSGDWPTNQAIYEALGRRGGMGTIQKHRSAFFESLKDRGLEALPAALPKDLVPLIEEWWNLSVQHAGEVHSEERRHLEDQIVNLESQKASLNETIVAVNQKVIEKVSQIDELERQVTKLTDDLSAKEALVQEIRGHVMRLEDQSDVIRAECDARVQDMENAHSQALEHHEDRISTLKQELAAAMEREKVEVGRSERNADHFLLEINTERERYRSMEASFKSVVDRLDSELRISRAREERLIQVNGENERKLEAAEAEVASLLVKIEQLSGSSGDRGGE